MTGTGKKFSGCGIVSHGAYVPRTRLRRDAIAAGVSWAIPAIRGLAKGERSVANWDEDSITMSVEAARNCLHGRDRSNVRHVMLASTTLPFADRSNSGIISDALNLGDDISNQDLAGSRRAGTSALIQLLQGEHNDTLLLAADCRETKPGSSQEMVYGHGAAGLLLGNDDPVAIPLAVSSIHSDLVDQYRSPGESEFDYALEERWVRQEGYLKLVPDVINRALTLANMEADSIDYFILPASANVGKSVAAAAGLTNAEIMDPLRNEPGDCGSAQPLLMLSAVLEQASPDQHILLTGFGQGADAIIFKTTKAINKQKETRGISYALAQGSKDDNYLRFLVTRRQLRLDFGIRSERDSRTALSSFYRNREVITGFVGGRCDACKALQYPLTNICVGCGQTGSQNQESFSEYTGMIKSYTEDWLAFTPLPPLVYGNITFTGGANVMMEFTDVKPGELAVGMEVKMMFRIKDIDEQRHFHRYFWKPVPLNSGENNDG